MLTENWAFVDLLHYWIMQGPDVICRMAAIEPAHAATQAPPSILSCPNRRPQRCRHLQGESSFCPGRSVRWRKAITRCRHCPVHVVAHVFA